MKPMSEGWKGFGVLAVLNAALAVGTFVAASQFGLESFIFIWAGLPALQLAWSVPMIVVARRRGRREYAKGLTVAAALTMLLGAGCWTFMLFTFELQSG